MHITNKIIDDSIRAPLGSTSLRSDSKIIQGPNWYQILTPSVANESLNEVIISRMDSKDFEQKVREVFRMYALHSLPFKWITGPMSSPPELEALLAPLAERSWGFRGMAASCGLELTATPGVTTELLAEQNFHEFLRVFLEGWNQTEDAAQYELDFRQAMLPESQRSFYLARHHGEPAGVAGTVLKEDHGYLTSSVVLPSHRGLGLYKALVRGRLSDLRARGVSHAVTQAREATSVPILHRLGFGTTFQGTVYRFAPGTRGPDQRPRPT